MKSGTFITCDSAWISEGSFFFSRGGKTYSLPLEDVDLAKTFKSAN
jgi:hypothetical protein